MSRGMGKIGLEWIGYVRVCEYTSCMMGNKALPVCLSSVCQSVRLARWLAGCLSVCLSISSYHFLFCLRWLIAEVQEVVKQINCN